MADLSFIHYAFIISKLQIHQINGCKINLVIDLAEDMKLLSFQVVMLFSIYLMLLSKQREKNCQNVACDQNHNEVPLHASQDGCYPKVYKQ